MRNLLSVDSLSPPSSTPVQHDVEAIPISLPTTFYPSKPIFNDRYPHSSAKPPQQNYETPVSMTSFSYDERGEFRLGPNQFESLRPFYETVDLTGCDLNYRSSEAIYRDNSIDRGIDGLLLSLVDFLDRSHPDERLKHSREISSTELITWRSTLAKLASTSSRTQHMWGLVEAVQSYHGRSYESLLTNQEFQPVNTNCQWISVVKSNLNRIPIILGGEVDCVNLETYENLVEDSNPVHQRPIPPDQFIELKLQSYPLALENSGIFIVLLGTPKVHIGYRSREGILECSQTYQTKAIPDVVNCEAKPKAVWSSDACLQNGTKIIEFLNSALKAQAGWSGQGRGARDSPKSLAYSHRIKFFQDRLDAIVAEEVSHQLSLRRNPTAPQSTCPSLSDTCRAQVIALQRWPVYRLVFKPHQASTHPRFKAHRAGFSAGLPASIEFSELSFEEVSQSILKYKPKNLFNVDEKLPASPVQGPNSNQHDHSNRVGFLPLCWVQRLVQMQVELLLYHSKKPDAVVGGYESKNGKGAESSRTGAIWEVICSLDNRWTAMDDSPFNKRTTTTMPIDFRLLSIDSLSPPSSPRLERDDESKENGTNNDDHQLIERLEKVIPEAIPISPPTRFLLPKPTFNGVYPHQSAKPPKQRYKTPVSITSYSYDERGQLRLGANQFESLKPFYDNVDHTGFDLNHLISEAVYIDPGLDSGIDHLLLSLVDFLDRCHPDERLKHSQEIVSTELITWRSLLAKLSSTVYQTDSPGANPCGLWSKRIMMINGTIHIEDDFEGEDLDDNIEQSSLGSIEAGEYLRACQESEIHCYHGFSFESLVTNQEFKPVNTNSRWISVVKSDLNQIKIILGGEVDCVNLKTYQTFHRNPMDEHSDDNDNKYVAQKPISTDHFIELKTGIQPSNSHQLWSLYRYKMLNYWIQSFIFGVPKVHVGYRSREGILCSSKTYETSKIPDIVKQKAPAQARWSSDVCLQNVTKIIQFIKNKLTTPASTNRADQIGQLRGAQKSVKNKLDAIIAKEIKHQLNLRADSTAPQPTSPSLSETCKAQVKALQRWPVYRLVFRPYQPPTNPRSQGNRAYSSAGLPGSIELSELSSEQVSQTILRFKPKNFFDVGGKLPDSTLKDPNPDHSHRVGFLPLVWVQRLVQIQVELFLHNQKK
ncbi:hypothetical protein PSTT_15472, partial [Puccinia striiformis]